MKDTQRRRHEVVLAGSGGQGLVLSGILLAEAAIREGRNVVQTQSYGIASRGGLSLAEVIIDDEEIVFPQVQSPTLILALTEEALRKYEAFAGQGVPLVYDTTLAAERKGPFSHGYPFTRLAGELGKGGVVNTLALGTLAACAGMVQYESLSAAIAGRFRGAAGALNIRALRRGFDLGKP